MKHALSFVGGVLLTLLLVALLYPEPKAGNSHNIVIQTDTIIKRDTVRDVPGEPKYTSEQPVDRKSRGESANGLHQDGRCSTATHQSRH